MTLTQFLENNQKLELSLINSSLFKEKTCIIYIPESTNQSGKNFINSIRKRGIVNEVLIPQFTYMYGRKTINKDYIEEFRKTNPNIKIVKTLKNLKRTDSKIDFIDATPMMDLFFGLIHNSPKYRIFIEFNKLINELIDESIKDSGGKFDTKFIFLFNLSNQSEFTYSDILYNFFRKRSFKIPKTISDSKNINASAISNAFKNIDGGFAYISPDESSKGSNLATLYPILNDSKNELLYKSGMYRRLKSEILNIDINISGDGSTSETLDERINNAKNTILDKAKIIDGSAKITSESLEDIRNISSQENIVDEIFQEISLLSFHMKNEKFLNMNNSEKINYLFKDADDKTKKTITKLLNYIDKLNEKYNGVVKINRNLLKDSSDVYYDPMDIVKIDELSVYNKQKTEFDEALDQSMFDLIKSIENDSEAGIKIKNIDVSIIDTNKSRFKVYKVTMKNTKFGKTTEYTKNIKVPYPIKSKYLKIGGVKYIMINQFYPKPILKVKPNMVRLYTQFSTYTCTLNTHKLNVSNDIDHIVYEFLKLNKKSKVDFLEDDQFNLPAEIKVTDKFNFYLDSGLIHKKITIK